MSIDPSTIIQAILCGVKLTELITNLLNLLHETNTMSSLIQADFKAGVRILESVKNANSETELKCQLRDARLCFQRAVDMDIGQRAAALLSLACCQEWLGETKNSRRALEEILQIGPILNFKKVIWKVTKETVKIHANPWMIMGTCVGMSMDEDLFGTVFFQALMEAVDEHEDGRSTLGIQFLVAEHLNKPVPWMRSIGSEHYDLVLNCMRLCAAL